jgi:two-component system sensor histidine kinase KdpD
LSRTEATVRLPRPDPVPMLAAVITPATRARERDPQQARGSRLVDLLTRPEQPPLPYAQALLWIAAATALAFAMFPLVDLANVVMVYLLAVVLVAARLGHGPAVVATIGAVATFVYLFVPHYYSFVLSDLRYLPTFVVMLLVGLVVAALTSRLRDEAITTLHREQRSQALYLLSRGLAAAETRAQVAAVVGEHLRGVSGSSPRLLEVTAAGELAPCGDAPGTPPPAAADLVAAATALRDRATRAAASGRVMLPMIVANEPVGVLCCDRTEPPQQALPADVRLLEAFANNAAISLHRLLVADAAAATQRRADEERLRNVMLSSMSHDFRTPLASITGAVTTLIDGDDRVDAATRLDLLHAIREDAEFLERQIRNMLDLTKLEAGTPRIRRELHPLDEVVGGAMTRAEKLLEGRRVDIDVPPQLPLVAVDALLIEQLLLNLLENAVHYAPPPSPIEVGVQQRGELVSIHVADRGPGVPRALHERVFEKFFRGSTSRRTGGAGLGLAICRAIAQLHGGSIGVEDRDGGGALFRLELPLRATPDADGAALAAGGSR